MLRIGVIGYGHWGPNHVRVFNQIPESRVQMVTDADPSRLEAARTQFPDLETTTRYEDLLAHPKIQAVVIATPATSHHSLTKAALLANKDVLVEKPIAYTVAEAEELIQIAEKNQRILMCGHIFVFNSGIRRLRDYLAEGALGRIYYMAATRTNLGPVRRDVNALFDLGSHDISIFQYLLGGQPREVMAWGECFLQHNVEDVTFACLEYASKTMCHMHVSWLNPLKERTLVVVGDKKMAVWNDTSPSEALRLYDKGLMEEPYYDSFGQFHLALRDADVLIPKLKAEEPLKVQSLHFLECVRQRQRPIADGRFARDVLETAEALQRSLRRGGSRQPLRPAPEKRRD